MTVEHERRLERLKTYFRDDVVLPGDRQWDRARAAWNLAVDQRPAAVVRPHTAEDVSRVVRFAADVGLHVAPQATGHNPGPLPSLENVILLKTDRMRGVRIDPHSHRAQAGGGAVWWDVAEPAGCEGMAPLAGSSPDVGVAGYTLGGGLSWLGRKYGLAANSVTAIVVVTADGSIRRADRDSEPELFWALRGGGGNFGVVTGLEFAIYPVPELYAGWLVWSMDRARDVMEAWTEWLAGVPDDVTSILRLMQVPAIPVMPEPLRGRDLVVVEAAMLLPERKARDLLGPLRRLRPEIDTFARIPPAALSHLHMDPDAPVPAMGDSRLLREMSPSTIDAIVASVGPGTASPLAAVEIRHLGGELGRPQLDGGALSHFDAEFLLFGAGIPTDPETADAIRRRLDVLFDRTRPWDVGHRYSNFVEGRTDPRRLFPERVYRRLAELRARLDPHGLFLANHAVPGSPYPPDSGAKLGERAEA